MSLSILAPPSGLWYSAHHRLLFGVSQPFYPSAYDLVFDDGAGQAVFHKSALMLFPFPEFSKRFFCDAGIYTGSHNIISYDPINEYIYTDTAFIGNDPPLPLLQRTIWMLIPFGYRIYYGYPTQTNIIDIKAFHKFDQTAYVNISEMIKNIYVLNPPQIGFDENMYTWFRIDIIPLEQTIDFFNTYGFTMQLFTGWNYLASIYYSLNAAVRHSILQNLVANDKFISEVDPIFIGDCCNLFTKIIVNRAYNIFNCPEGSEYGIGFMQIENNLIVG